MADKIYMNYIYPSSLLRQLSDLWKSEQMCDAVITVDKVIIAKAHKLVLLAISSKLKSDSNNSSQTAFLEVNLPSGLQHKSVNAFLQYLYEGFLLLTKEIVSDMIRIAEYLDIECLLSCCKEYKKTLTASDKSDSESSPENGFQKDFKHVRCTITKEKSEMDKRSRDNEDSDSNSAVEKRGRKKRRKHSSDDSDNGSVSNKSFHRISKEPHHHVQLADESSRIKVEPADQDGCEVENSSVSQDSTQHSSHSLPSKSPIENVISKNSSISLLDDDIIEIKEEPDDEDFSIIESSFSNTPQNYQSGSYSNTFPGQSTPMASSSQVTPSIISRQSVSDIDYLTQRLNQDQQDLQYQDDGSGTQESYGAYDPSDGQVPGTSGSFSQEEREKHLPMYRPNFVVSQPPTHFADRHNKEVLQRERVRTSVACCVCRKPRCVYSLKKLNKEQEETLWKVKGDENYICGKELEVGRHVTGLVTRRSLDCSSPIEMAYYGASYTSLPPCCYHCGSYTNLLDMSHPYMKQLLKEYTSVKPLCEACYGCGKLAKTRGQKIDQLDI